MTWDKTKPATSSSIVSSEIRQQWDAIEGSMYGQNMIADGNFQIWHNADTGTVSGTSPTHYSVTGGTSYANREVGSIKVIGAQSCKIVAVSAEALLRQAVMPASGSGLAYFGSKKFTIAAFVYATTGSVARLSMFDGTTRTYSAYHTGNSTWQLLTKTVTMQASPTSVYAEFAVASGGTAYVSGMMCFMGEVAPSVYVPSPSFYGTIFFPIAGTQVVATQKGFYVPQRPLIVMDVQLFVRTLPTGAALIVDVNTLDGAAYTSMFSTRPQVAATASGGSARPDTTYVRRCTNGYSGNGFPVGSVISIDVDQIGSTAAGSDLSVHVRALQFIRPHEFLLNYNHIGSE